MTFVWCLANFDSRPSLASRAFRVIIGTNMAGGREFPKALEAFYAILLKFVEGRELDEANEEEG